MQENNSPTNDNDGATLEVAKRRTKLDIAQSKLPEITSTLQGLLEDTIARVSSIVDLDVLASHLTFEVRRRRTLAANVAEAISVGQAVRIVSGPHDAVGHVGTVVSAKRVRIHVECGDGRVHYLFRSDVEPVESASTETVVESDDEGPETLVTAVG